MVENVKIEKLKWDILSGQKFIKNAKNGRFWRVISKGQKLVENAKIQMRHFE